MRFIFSNNLKAIRIYYLTYRDTLFCRKRLHDLFGQIEKEFENLYAENLACRFLIKGYYFELKLFIT